MPESSELRERLADALAHHDACGPGPVSRDEYLADADALIKLVREDRPSVSVEPVATLWHCPVHSGLLLQRGTGRCRVAYGPAANCDAYLERVPVFSERDMQVAQERADVLENGLGEAHEIVGALEAERDEAREALRELLEASDEAGRVGGSLQRLVEAEDLASTVLQDLRRTHALVPIEILERLSVAVVSTAKPEAGDEVMSQALDAAARGERQEWPAS